LAKTFVDHSPDFLIGNVLKSRRSVVSEAGGDFENTLEEIAQDKALAESKGLELDGDKAEETD
jgi:capsid protein